MTGSCCICKKSYKNASIQLFRFPFKNPVKLRKWVDAIKISGFWLTPSSRICSDHFLESDYDHRPNARIPRLKDSAVPSRNLTVIQASVSVDSPRPILVKPEPTPKIDSPKPQIILNQPPLLISNLNNQKKIILTDISSFNQNIQKTNTSFPILLRPVPPLVPTSNVKKDVSTQMAVSSQYLNRFKNKMILLPKVNNPVVNQVKLPEVPIIERTTQTRGIQTKIETEKELMLKRKVKSLQQRVRRKEKKISCLKEVLYALKKRGVLEPDASELIDHYFDDSE